MKVTIQGIVSRLLVVLILFSGSLALAWDHWDHHDHWGQWGQQTHQEHWRRPYQRDNWERHDHWAHYHSYPRAYYNRPYVATPPVYIDPIEPIVELATDVLPFLAPVEYGWPRVIERVPEPGISIYIDSGN